MTDIDMGKIFDLAEQGAFSLWLTYAMKALEERTTPDKTLFELYNSLADEHYVLYKSLQDVNDKSKRES